MEFTFDPVNHRYFLDGKPVTGVTTIIGVISKPALIGWAAGMVCTYIKENCGRDELERYLVTVEDLEQAKTAHARKKTDAASIGTVVHEEIENYIKGQIEGTYEPREIKDRKARAMYENFVGWAKENEVTFHESEKKLYSEKHWCAGTADFTCSIGDKTFVGDIKTSSRIYPENFIQTAAYRMMLEEMGIGERYDGSVVVNIKKDGKFNEKKDVKYRFDYQTDLKAFLGALDIYKYLGTFN